MAAVLFLVALGLRAFHVKGEQVPLELDSENWDLYVTPNGLAMVEFHAGTRHPEFSQAARLLRDVVPLGRVDVRYERALADKFSVRDFPSLWLFKRGRPEPYAGGQTVKDLTFHALEALDAFVEESSSQPSASDEFGSQDDFVMPGRVPPNRQEDWSFDPHMEMVNTVTELNHLLEMEDVVVFGFFDTVDEPGLQVFEKVSKVLGDEYPFAAITAPPLIERFEIGELPVILLHRSNAEHSLTYEGQLELEDLTQWVQTHGFVPLMELTASEIERRLLDEVPSVVTFVDPAADATPHLLDQLRSVSPQFKNDMDFFYADGRTLTQLATSLALMPGLLPSLVIFDPKHHKRYVFPHSLQQQEVSGKVATFCEAFLDGDLQHTVKSEPEPPPPPPGTPASPVEVITSLSFERVVLDTRQDVLAELC